MNITADAQPSYLFQSYQTGENNDSPPSLTNSSESPRSTSEEGGSSSPRASSFSGSTLSTKPNHALGNQRPVTFTSHTQHPVNLADEDEDNSIAEQAMSPNWESVFGSAADTPESMDFTKENAATPDIKQENQQSSTISRKVAGNVGGSNDSTAYPATKWQSAEDTKMTDDAMFESLIQQENFDQSAGTDAREDESVGSETSGQKISNMTAKSQSFDPSAISALSSRRNSNESDQMKYPRALHSGSHYSHTSDADLPSSSQVVVRPPLEELKGLQVHVHGISFAGAKSRVETQIRLRLELVRPTTEGEASTSNSTFERIGVFDHVKLPPLTGTKRRSKKHKQADVATEKTLFMDAAVVRATPPHERVFVCKSCQQREKKRAQRRKSGAKKDEGKDEDDQQYTLEDYQELGIDPDSANAKAEIKRRSEEEAEKRVVVFNCGDFVNFEEGQCVLPTRITCYCRHHREKTGFCLIFTMRDYRGNLVASGSTPPIMITDDHKSVAAAAAAAAAAANTSTNSDNIRRVDGSRSRAGSSENTLEGSAVAGKGGESNAAAMTNGNSTAAKGRKARRATRSKPYGDVEERNASRRSGTAASLSTGQNTPAIAQSPPTSQPDINNPDFWNAFAAMANVAGSPTASSRASQGVQTPQTEVTSPMQQARSLSMQGMGMGLPQQQQQQHLLSALQQLPQHPASPPNLDAMQQWAAGMAAQGSISSQTLNVGPQSVPGFDLNTFMQSIQRGQGNGDQNMQNLLMLARSLPGMTMDANLAGNQASASGSAQASNTPIPSISKLIPGEGPTSGGIEVTVLGENFVDGLTCYFGDIPATSTRVWGSNTLLCLLPPSASPGPVAVTVKGPGSQDHNVERFNNSLQLFTYIDATDRALMELALQVVGLQMTGQMQSARDVAMRVVGSGPNQNITRSQGNGNSSGGSQGGTTHSRNAVAGLFATMSGNQSFQDSVMGFLRLLDVDLEQNDSIRRWRRDAVRLSNKQGHTLLHLAVILGFHRLASDLIQRGCPINARDYNGYTALHFAALHGRVMIARMLIGQGANARIICEVGRDALDVARESEQVDVETLLEDHLGLSSLYNRLVEADDESDEDELSAEIDDDNVSSYVDEESENYLEDEEESDYQDEDDEQLERGEHPALTASIDFEPASARAKKQEALGTSSNEKDSQSINEKAAEAGEERKAGLKGLVFGGLDFANRARFGVPTALHGGFTHFNVPVVSVFQMALPPSFTNWGSIAHSNEEGSSSQASAEKSVTEDDKTQSSASMWRNIFEESALWINPLSSPPPPAYDSLHAPAIGESRFPAIASTSSSQDSARLTPKAISSEQTPTRPRSVSIDDQSRVETASTPSSSKSPSRKANKSASTPAGLSVENRTKKNEKQTSKIRQNVIARAPSSLKDDRMLVYFWLPILVSVLLLLCSANPSSILSYGDLMSFMPF
ncbi:uncharacterized protein FA14DRAFT_169630 [Meira miltonrushii]|uniref:IPT/TIG domain-containing protein n=1 Tax=Meira miltonrushii TaxID=1280837 RepID=A0A316VGA2_9BASI|nr:uncharacterized protein FA14DRAFT_169630 [Meira miltonrushii]PWN36659.1 hypothetical protein FA14DRAFT_169630 [Meira miltonrushii]